MSACFITADYLSSIFFNCVQFQLQLTMKGLMTLFLLSATLTMVRTWIFFYTQPKKAWRFLKSYTITIQRKYYPSLFLCNKSTVELSSNNPLPKSLGCFEFVIALAISCKRPPLLHTINFSTVHFCSPTMTHVILSWPTLLTYIFANANSCQ